MSGSQYRQRSHCLFFWEALSRPGERDYNEDFAKVQRRGEAFCFVLADGLGGHGSGDEASRLVCECICSDFAVNGVVSEPYLRLCFELSQKMFMKEQERLRRESEMKTTLTVLLADRDWIQWGHIGDSRIYYFQDKKLKIRTLDHSVPQMLVSAGQLKEKQIRGHADRSRLLKKAKEPKDWLSGMEATVRKRGSGKGMDNYTAVAVFL